MKEKPELIYQDADILVVNKPPNLLAIPDRYSPELPSLLDYLRTKFGEVFKVHRLDRPTSGIMIFARNEAAHRQLSLQFETRKVVKIYLALVEGILHPEEGSIDKPIAPHPTVAEKMIVHPKGKPSLTTYKTVEHFKNFTLVEAQLHTGRTHQIRVHFESIGFPMAVDEIYGRRKEIYFTDIKKNRVHLAKFEEPRPLMSRTSLHALRLTFEHPVKEQPLTFEAPLPKDFRALLYQLRQWGK